MAIEKTSVEYMKEYLKYALEFEKFVYIWTNAMEQANVQKREIYSRKSSIQHSQLSAQTQLSTLDYDFEQYIKQDQSQLLQYKKNEKKWLSVALVWLIFSFIVAFFSVSLIMDFQDPLYAIIITAIATVCCFLFGFFIGPIALYQHSKNKKKYNKLKQSINNQDNIKEKKQNTLTSQSIQARENLATIVKEEEIIEKRQDEIFKELTKAKRQLANLYSDNSLPIKYRNISAIATMYEYLETGRCNTIQGHGGIYDTYEVERIALEQLAQMVIMNQTLQKIEDNQRYICRELRQANQTLSHIKSSLKEIAITNEEIAKNTAISAVASQQIATTTNWLAWRTWANGY